MRVDEGRGRRCGEIEPLLVFYACNELEGSEQAAVAEHLRGCAACSQVLERERRLLGAAAGVSVEPPAALLARCRDELDDSLDALAEPGRWRKFAQPIHPARWFVLHPSWSAALLLFIGIALGNLVPGWLVRPVPQAPVTTKAPAPNPAPALGEQDLRSVDISAINWQPGSASAPPSVELHLTAEKPLVIRGTVNDSNVRRLLLYVVSNEQRFDSGVRLDSLELLKNSSHDAEARKAFCNAAHHDRNPGVRLKALEALGGFAQDDQVRQTLLDLLVHDANPGVRIEALNELRQIAEQSAVTSDARLRKVLEDRMHNDPNNYVRLQSAAVVRQLGPRESY